MICLSTSSSTMLAVGDPPVWGARLGVSAAVCSRTPGRANLTQSQVNYVRYLEILNIYLFFSSYIL